MTNDVMQIFSNYPDDIRALVSKIRQLVFDIAENENLGAVEEALKWGQPSYLVKGGSTLRMSWSLTNPNEIRIYFICKTRLVEVFKEIFGDTFKYETNRAIVLNKKSKLPIVELRQCISMALRYHTVKNLPLLGA